jgi:hypothetical protein
MKSDFKNIRISASTKLLLPVILKSDGKETSEREVLDIVARLGIEAYKKRQSKEQKAS